MADNAQARLIPKIQPGETFISKTALWDKFFDNVGVPLIPGRRVCPDLSHFEQHPDLQHRSAKAWLEYGRRFSLELEGLADKLIEERKRQQGRQASGSASVGGIPGLSAATTALLQTLAQRPDSGDGTTPPESDEERQPNDGLEGGSVGASVYIPTQPFGTSTRASVGEWFVYCLVPTSSDMACEVR